MQVPLFSPRISLIEMTPRLAPRSGCPARPALFVTTDRHHRERAVIGRIFQALPNFCPDRQTKRHHVCFYAKDLIYKDILAICYNLLCKYGCFKKVVPSLYEDKWPFVSTPKKSVG
jgi:hypothetical protein